MVSSGKKKPLERWNERFLGYSLCLLVSGRPTYLPYVSVCEREKQRDRIIEKENYRGRQRANDNVIDRDVMKVSCKTYKIR